MIVEKQNIQKLCKSVKRIVKHHNDIAKIKGEHFNVFSILNMESKENGTHSAFLGELLNPDGSHNLGTAFLDLFLNVVKKNDLPFNIDKSNLKLEQSIGKRNDDKKTGGRIDIFIKDDERNTICIENKIYAQDQNVQIERYCNYNIGKNTVYYLSLDGSEPSKKSRGKLISGTDYYSISYQLHIVNWLELCLKEAANHPILRESIKQYIILIKKLTETLNTEQEKELTEVIFDHYEEAKLIASNYYNIVNKIREQFRIAVFKELVSRLDNTKYEVFKGHDAYNKNFSQLWIKYKKFPNSKQFYGIESFNGKGNYKGTMFIGIHNQEGGSSNFKPESDDKLNQWWTIVKRFKVNKDERINMSNSKTLKAISSSEASSFKNLVNEMCSQVELFIKENEKILFTYLESNK